MADPIELQTSRLELRRWRDADRAPFAAMNADPEVMEYFPALLSRTESDAFLDRCQGQLDRQGWGLWAVEILASKEFIGFVGLSVPARRLPFAPCVEVGWRLARAFWRRGFATEAARASLAVGFERLGLPEIVSFTTLRNLRSRAVMERLGLRNTGRDFDHPALPPGHALRRHCLYRITRAEWQAAERSCYVARQPTRLVASRLSVATLAQAIVRRSAVAVQASLRRLVPRRPGQQLRPVESREVEGPTKKCCDSQRATRSTNPGHRDSIVTRSPGRR